MSLCTSLSWLADLQLHGLLMMTAVSITVALFMGSIKKTSKPKWSALSLFLALLIVAGFFYFSGCVVIPDHLYVLKGVGSETTARLNSDSCELPETIEKAGAPESSLNPAGFSVLSWNSHKGADHGFTDDLETAGQGADLLLLQEAALDKNLTEKLRDFARVWLLAVAFKNNGTDVGIMTASRVLPVLSCAFSEPEPLLTITKIILVSSYPIAGGDEELLVVNVHMVNFTITSDALQRQIAAVTGLIEQHRGPVIVAGDFNTWNGERESVVYGEMERLGLQSVQFDPDNRTVFLKHVVDRIFYRGLEVVRAESLRVQSSDHNPLAATFKLLDNS